MRHWVTILTCTLALSACAASPNYDRLFGDALSAGKIAQEETVRLENEMEVMPSARELRGAVESHLNPSVSQSISMDNNPREIPQEIR